MTTGIRRLCRDRVPRTPAKRRSPGRRTCANRSPFPTAACLFAEDDPCARVTDPPAPLPPEPILPYCLTVLPDPDSIVNRLKSFQAIVRDLLARSRASRGLSEVRRESAADTIYQIDTLVEPVLEDFCREWARTTPLVLIAEGIEPAEGAGGPEGVKVFPEGAAEEDAEIRVIVDPIDGTRGLMYDKRAAWALAGVAPNKGGATRLRDVEVAVMTELPTAKMGRADVLWATKGRGAHGERIDECAKARRVPVERVRRCNTGIEDDTQRRPVAVARTPQALSHLDGDERLRRSAVPLPVILVGGTNAALLFKKYE